MFIALTALLIIKTQVDFGGKPHLEPPSKLELIIEQVGSSKTRPMIRCLLVNSGGGRVKVDPAMLSPESQLMVIRFTGSDGKRIHYKGDNIGAYIPLQIEPGETLYAGSVYGFQRGFDLQGKSRAIRVQAYCRYREEKKLGFWSGDLKSNAIWLR